MKSLSYLNKYFIKYKWRLLAGVLFIVASNFFQVKMPIYLKDTIDDFINGTSSIELGDAWKIALLIGGTYMSLSVLKGIFLFFTRQTIIKVSRFIEFDLKNEIYIQYQKLDYLFYKRNNTGDLMNRISEDVSHVRMYLGPGVMYTVNLVVLFSMVIFQMVQISWFLTVVVLIPLPIMSFIIYKVSSRINKISSNVQKEQSNMSSIVQETFSGIRVIKAYIREKEVNQKFNDSAMNYKSRNMRLVLVNALFMPTILLLIGLSTVLSIYVGGVMSYTGEISLGDIIAFIFFVNILTWPFASVGWVTSIIQRAAASQSRINEFLNEKPTIVNPTDVPFKLEGAIEFKDVSYTYENSGIEAVKNLSFKIEPGETVAFIGRTGCGKSTILKLLLRQIEPTSGSIYIDGKPLNSVNLDDFRKQTGIVPQEVFLFSDTISNNISFGSTNGNISQEAIENVTKIAHVHHNIIEFEDQYETLLGERGVNLSGGQKQRLSIARALVRDPKLLVLDDCLSAVDTETEERILSNLKKSINNKTSIIVSHRVSTIRNADRIIVIQSGSKIEEGVHDELMALQGIYTDIYTKQLAEENT